jgi:hypothetical protein
MTMREEIISDFCRIPEYLVTLDDSQVPTEAILFLK